jgi:hypothetical protein
MELQQLEKLAHERIAAQGAAQTFKEGAEFVAGEIQRLSEIREQVTKTRALTPAENAEFEQAFKQLAYRAAIQIRACQIATAFDQVTETPHGYRTN